jgi:long-chain fatty acid transport protein
MATASAANVPLRPATGVAPAPGAGPRASVRGRSPKPRHSGAHAQGRALLAALVLGALVLPAREALASGFALREQSASALGNAFAGATAGAEDPSYMFFNPAALARQRGSQAILVATYVAPVNRFDGKDAQTAAGVPIEGGDGSGDVTDDAVLPALYAVWDVGELLGAVDDLKLGLGINVPFGLETDYDPGWLGRYHALQSKLKTINVNPVVAFDVVEGVSVGAGLQVQYASAELSNAIDFGTLAAGVPALAPVADPTRQDGRGRVEGDDIAYGYTLGLLVEPWQGTRFGVGYRSALRHELDGDARFRFDQDGVGRAISGATGAFTSTGASAKLNLPETLSFGVHHDLDERWSITGEAAWTRWSRFDELRIRFDNPAQPDSVTEEEWNDTWFFALGATWRPSEDWDVRFGVAYDQSPIPNAKRTPRVPGNDRYWISIGASYRPSPGFALSLGYTHIFVEDASVKLAAGDPGNGLRGDLAGDIETSIDLFGAQLRYVF